MFCIRIIHAKIKVIKPRFLKCYRALMTLLCCKKEKQVKMPPIEHIQKVLPREQFESVELENFQMVDAASKLFFWLVLIRQLMSAVKLIRA